jgi:DNA-binding GntR family transcriptional regulator
MAYMQIREEILKGNFAIGNILSRRRLAERLNMSFVPITEALQRLEADGLVESRPRIGTRVCVPTEESIRGIYVLREALESQSARLCAQNISAEEKKQFLNSAEHLDDLYRTSRAPGADPLFLYSVHTYHMQFHMRIARLANCDALTKAIEKGQVLVFNWLYDRASERSTMPPDFHSELARAICTGDARKADEAMRRHVRYGLDEVLARFAKVEYDNVWRLRST